MSGASSVNQGSTPKAFGATASPSASGGDFDGAKASFSDRHTHMSRAAMFIPGVALARTVRSAARGFGSSSVPGTAYRSQATAANPGMRAKYVMGLGRIYGDLCGVGKNQSKRDKLSALAHVPVDSVKMGGSIVKAAVKDIWRFDDTIKRVAWNSMATLRSPKAVGWQSVKLGFAAGKSQRPVVG